MPKIDHKNHLPFSAAAMTIRSRNDENKAALTLVLSDSGEDNDGWDGRAVTTNTTGHHEKSESSLFAGKDK